MTTIEKRNSLSLKERLNFDNNLINNLTKNYETKIELLNDNLQEKENEINRLEQELEDCPNPDLEFILEQKKIDLKELQDSTKNELNTMKSDYEKLLESKESDRKQEIEQMKMANNIAMTEKDEEMKRMQQELEEFKSKQEKMSHDLIYDFKDLDEIKNQQVVLNKSNQNCWTKLYN